MSLRYRLARLLEWKREKMPHHWINDMPGAFAAADKNDNVMFVGWQGEWYKPIKPSLVTRLHNWLVRDREH